ncbi:hypothetical protein L226DRAFT_480967 [Lentinus tigrinus ALCF2SS1-7]|uniref:uncharacterized protein n=1 Tax=Lentinus tigrinus ALCF2SS1-7 TaxID=1328758 RepID=UPI001165C9EC|nr:hypothetical protein L226DRAFT_480967 [Lentinus tigrinus ALCF2SS1-7]
MPAPAKKARSRKAAKDTASARQTSLLDVFSVRSSSKKNSPSNSAAVSENGSTAGEGVIDILSSDAEPLEERPVDSSSPTTVEEGSEAGGLSEISNITMGPASQPGGTWEEPIVVVDSSPVASPAPPSKAVATAPRLPAPPKPVYSIFAPRKRPDQYAPSQGKDSRHPTKPFAPYPDDVTQHVRGPQTVYNTLLTNFSRRQPRDSRPITPNSDADTTLYSRLVSSPVGEGLGTNEATNVGELAPVDASARERIVNSIPLNHRSYPAISRLLELPLSDHPPTSDPPVDANTLWSYKWRPKCADQVLGNEQAALYLREWLLALKLHISGGDEAPTTNAAVVEKNSKQKAGKVKKAKGPRGTKRPRIVRDVERKRRRVDSEEPEDTWIAEDSEGEDPLDVIGLPEDDSTLPQLSRLKRATGDDLPDTESIAPVPEELPELPLSDGIPPFSYTPPKFGDTVYNTLLLEGPSGCGKTAAVYACAEELSWEVFEVYPGIGERNGSAIQKLIGEVGKNHLVTQTQHQAKADRSTTRAKAKANFFAKRVVSDDEEVSLEHPALSNIPETQDVAQHQQPPTEVSQSIVLIEEVDVLYREDTNFWPTVVKIIKECRRPVVMTCNDISLVPRNDLPLQTVLKFTACPTALATSYLQLVCLAEGRILEPKSLRALYQTSFADARLERQQDQDLHPQYIPPVEPDLRRSLMQLQLADVVSAPCEIPVCEITHDQSSEAFRRMVKAVETRSIVYSGLRRPSSEVLRDLMVNSPSRSSDDVVGLKYLRAEPSDFDSYLPVTFTSYVYDETIRQHLLTFCQDQFSSPDPLDDTPDLPPLHTTHFEALFPALDRLRVPREQLFHDPAAVFVDYEPWIRYMVRADDARISAYLASGLIESTTRRTRNSQRSQWERERWVPLDDHERNTLMSTAFDRDAVDAVTNAATTDPEPSDSL